LNGPSREGRVRLGLSLTLFGFFILVIGAKPGWFGIDRSPIVGFVQTAVFVIGLGILSLGGGITFIALWGNQARSILADIGLRLVATGYVIATFAGMADVFGFGSHSFPKVPFFGPWQAYGVMIGEGIILLGFLLLLPLKAE
ncbi:MAG: hypothetical protein ACK8QZ_01860, partial [Anaerolineales bacterium]